MIEHVRNTIAGLDLKILSLQNLRKNLLDVFGPSETVTTPAPVAETAPTPPQEPDQPVTKKRKYTRRAAAAGRPPGRKEKAEKAVARTPRRAPAATTAELLIQIIGKLRQPFSTDDLMNKSGIDAKKATNTIQRMIAKRWLERVSRGAYERTDRFGTDARTAKAAPASEPAGSDEEQTPPPAPARPVTPAPTPVASVHDLAEGSLERKVYFQAVAGPQPFTAAAVAVALGCSKDAVGIAIVKLERKGYAQYIDDEDGEKLYKTTNK